MANNRKLQYPCIQQQKINTFLIQIILLVLTSSLIQCSESFSLTTSSVVRNATPLEVFDFIATPTNWPSIVASSHSVKQSSEVGNPVDVPLKVGDFVEEIFGLPPLLPLSVAWECVMASKRDGTLAFYSKDGVPNFAKNCSMKFEITPDDANDDDGETTATNVKLVMGFEALNPLVFVATPLLNVDNSLALNVLLPLAIKRSQL